MSNYISAFKRFLDKHQLETKIFLMPGFTSGNQFMQKLADENIKLLNFNIKTLSGLVKELLEEDLYQNDLEVIDNYHSTLLIYKVLSRLKAEDELQYFNKLSLTDGVLNMLTSSIQEFRMAGYSSTAIKDNNLINDSKKNDLYRILERYEASLKSNKYLDKPALYNRAIEKDFKLSEEVLIKPDILELTPLEENCLESISPSSLIRYDIELLEDDGRYEDNNFELLNSYGSSNELLSIIRKLKERNIELDKTALYYLKKDPYSQLLYDLYLEYDLPVTFGEGISIKNSQPAEVYYQEIKDIDEDYNISGKVQPDDLARRVLERVKSDSLTDTEINREARELIINKLELFASYFNIPEEIDVIIERFNDLIISERVGSGNQEPGHLHLASYQDSIWSNRPYKYFLGLEENNMPGARNEDPVLLDEEREAYGFLKTQREKNREELEELKQIILSNSGKKGSISLSYSTFDIIEDREQTPSFLYLAAFRKDRGDSSLDYNDIKNEMADPAGFVSANKAECFNLADYWLYKHIREKEIANNEDLLYHFYPNYREGMKVLALQVEPKFNQYTGNIDNLNNSFDPRDNDEVTFSASRLETMAKCPYKYFLKYFLDLSTPEKEKDQTIWLTPLERGSLLHIIYRIFFEELTERGEEPALDKHLGLIHEIADQEAEKQREDIVPPNDNIYRLELKEIKSLCRFFLNLAENMDYESKPVAFEYSFDEVELDLPDGRKIYISGKIDRIDLNDDGSYNIIDYKTGSDYSFSTNNYFDQGQQLQHALYAAAYEKESSKHKEVKDFIYLFVNPKANNPQYIRSNDRVDILKEIIDILLNSIAEGAFVPTPYDKDRTLCRICDFNKIICEREKKDALTDLYNNDSHDKLAALRRLKSYD